MYRVLIEHVLASSGRQGVPLLLEPTLRIATLREDLNSDLWRDLQANAGP